MSKSKQNYYVEDFSCNGSGGRITGKLYIPSIHEKKLPTVILSHGYNSCFSDLTDLTEQLATNGICACCYDFCGGSLRSKSEGNPLEMSIPTEQSDLKAVVNKVMSLDFVNNDKVFLYGESQGGFVSALVAVELKDKLAGLALLYPAFCIPDDWLNRNETVLPESFNIMGMTLSRKFYYEVPRYDVFEYVSAFTKPVLLMHGTEDFVVQLSYAQKAAKSFKNCRLELFDGQGHGFAPKEREEACSMVTEFVKTQL